MNASWIARCFPEDAAGSGTEADGCCRATEHPSAPVIPQERLIAWCCSFLLVVWAVGPACGPGMLSLLGRRAGSQDSSESAPVWLCSRKVVLASQHTEFDSSLGRGFPISPAGRLPFPPPLVPPKFVQWQSFKGRCAGLGAAWGRKQRGKCGTAQLGRAAALPPRNGNSPCHQWE